MSDDREYEVAKFVDGHVNAYRAFYLSLPAEAQLKMVHYADVRGVVLSRVAKTGQVRFRKAKGKTYVDGVPNEAYLFETLGEHKGYGAYRSIDSLMMCRFMFPAEVYDRWELTVDVMYLLVQDPSAGPRIVEALTS